MLNVLVTFRKCQILEVLEWVLLWRGKWSMEFAINLMRVIRALVICNTNRKNQNRFENMKDSQGML